MAAEMGRWHYRSLFTLLIVCVLALCAQLGFIYCSDVNRFPINTVKIAASFQHITRSQLELVLSAYQTKSYFTLPVSRLQHELLAFDWAGEVHVKRIWPDVLNIKIVEKEPLAKWNSSLITAEGQLFNVGAGYDPSGLPILKGPDVQSKEVLQIYQKLSKLLETFGLNVKMLQLYENQSWDLTLTNGIYLHLGKQDIEKRLERFCKAYHGVFADKASLVARVDLRYERGMAIRWRDNKKENNG